jgi:hypothetical protein
MCTLTVLLKPSRAADDAAATADVAASSLAVVEVITEVQSGRIQFAAPTPTRHQLLMISIDV